MNIIILDNPKMQRISVSNYLVVVEQVVLVEIFVVHGDGDDDQNGLSDLLQKMEMEKDFEPLVQQ